MNDYEQQVYDILYDWWDTIFNINPPPVDRNGNYIDKNSAIVELVRDIAQVGTWDAPIPEGVDPWNLRGRSC